MSFRDPPYLYHPCTGVNYTCWTFTWVLGIQPQMFAWQVLYQLSQNNRILFLVWSVYVCSYGYTHARCMKVRGQPSTLFKTRNHLLLQTPWWLAWEHSGILLFLPSIFSRSIRITHMLSCQALHKFWGSELRSACLCDKCFTHWVIPILFLFLRQSLITQPKP